MTQTRISERAMLEALVLRCLILLKGHRTDVTAREVLAECDLPPSRCLLLLIERAGYPNDGSMDIAPGVRERIVEALGNGVWSARVIADEVGCAIEHVDAVRSGGYGVAPYGIAQYGRCKKVSDGSASVQRRVTVVGQISYRRRCYSLGQFYRGRIASILDRGRTLSLTFGDRPPLELATRDWAGACGASSLER